MVRCKRSGRDYFEVAGDVELHNADGICFFDDENNLQGTVINRVEGGKISPQKMSGIAAGRLIYRNYDHKFHQLIEKKPAERKIALTMRVYETAEGVALEGVDEDGNCATIVKACDKRKAEKDGSSTQEYFHAIEQTGQYDF